MMQQLQEAPRIVRAARIHSGTGVAGDALLIRNGVIVGVGELADLRHAYPNAEIADFAGATITPGLTDSHIHITEWAVARREIDLSAATSLDHAVRLVEAGLHTSRDGWVLGRGWNPHHWGGDYPTAALLDRVLAERPAAFQSHDMHSLWVNSAALERAGIDANTPDPAGGRIVRDLGGAPTGTLLENGAQLVLDAMPKPTDDYVLNAVIDAQAQLRN